MTNTKHTPTPAQVVAALGNPAYTAVTARNDALTAQNAALVAALRGIAMGAAPDGSAHFTVEMARRMASAALAAGVQS